MIGTRQLRDHVPLGQEFDCVQLAGQPAPGEKEAWNADALMEGGRAGTGMGDFLAALEDRVKAEETPVGAAPTASGPVGRLPQQNFGRDRAVVSRSVITDQCPICLAVYGNRKSGSSRWMADLRELQPFDERRVQ